MVGGTGAPIRVNGIHPGIVGRQPVLGAQDRSAPEGTQAKTLSGAARATMADVERRSGLVPVGEPGRGRSVDLAVSTGAGRCVSAEVAVVGAGRMGGGDGAGRSARGRPPGALCGTAPLARAVDVAAAAGGGRSRGRLGRLAVGHGGRRGRSALADDAAVTETYTGPGGVAPALHEGQVILEMSTIAPHTIRDIRPAVEANGAALLDAPVSGSVCGRRTGLADGDGRRGRRRARARPAGRWTRSPRGSCTWGRSAPAPR